jgi:hypothetical protein
MENVTRTFKSAMILLIGLVVITLCMGSLQAHADFDDTADGFYTVASNGSTDYVNEFALNGAKPWLYINAPLTTVLNGMALSWWDAPSESAPEFMFVNPVSSNQIWVSLNDSVWDSIKEVGTWNVDAYYSLSTLDSGSFTVVSNPGAASFTVTPEPVSSVLFLLGGAGLIARRFKR